MGREVPAEQGSTQKRICGDLSAMFLVLQRSNASNGYFDAFPVEKVEISQTPLIDQEAPQKLDLMFFL